jgi:hypothetical protein
MHPMASQPLSPRERWAWAAVAVGAVPVAWALVASGHGMRVGSPVTDIGGLVLLAVAEEVVFRGGLQAWLMRRPPFANAFLGLSGANALASMAFSAAHLWQHSAVQAAAVFPVSLLFGLAYERSGSRLAGPAALHVWFNLLLYTASALRAAG